MDVDLVLRVVTVTIALAGAAKILYELYTGNRIRMREEYKFAREFFGDLEKHAPGSFHPYLREKGYQAIAGDSRLSGDEIEYLLSLTRPERALRDYVLGRHYLQHVPQSGNLQMKFKKKYEAKWSRQWRIGLYGLFYFVFAFAAFTPWVFSGVLELSFQRALAAFGLCLVLFGPYAVMSLRAAARIHRAQMLVAHQDRHTQKIVLPVGQRIRSAAAHAQR